MKKILFLLLIPVLFACSSQTTTQTTVKLHLSNAEFDEVKLQILHDYITYNSEDLTATLNEEGYFFFEPNPANATMAFLTLGRQRISFYLEPGAQVQIHADMHDWNNTLSFEGSLAAENEFLKRYNQEIAPRFSQQQTFAMYREAGPEEFAHYAGQMFIEGTAFMDDFHRENPLGETFRQYFDTHISYQVYRNLVNYPSYRQWFAQLEEKPVLPDDFFDFLADAMDFDDNKLIIPAYTSFLGDLLTYLQEKHKDQIPAELTAFEQRMWIADEFFTGKTRDYVKVSLIVSELNHGNFANGQAAYEQFKASSNSQEYKAMLAGVYEKASRVAPGQPAPSFTLTSIEGEEVSLEDFKGKVVYLDFWASWCGPCMREVPFAKELKKRFEGENDLVFLYVSVDEDEEAWRRTVAQQEIQGVHVNVKGMRHDIAQLYNVQGVPSFFIIDRNGMIHNNNPSRPSGNTIDQELREVLDEQVI